MRGLEPFAERYGVLSSDRPARLRAALFHGTRVGGLGLLEDLQDLSQIVHQARMGWLSVYHAARALRDAASRPSRRRLSTGSIASASGS